ncbi:MAG: dTDP-4-dehydrorhamnose 3,5-epimerase [Flavobacteriales bacterium]|jgi:dTDP-4-dehydrorhamnose 3,5-epimerase|nr:MAG: dTDP-4-dehydrorhamnose 3,5-epimerase [Flavobacteriales bacterium]
MMETTTYPIQGLLLMRPRIFADDRGSFMETWSQPAMDRLIGPRAFVQDNESTSRRGVLRGLHFQIAPHAQGKLVRVVRGAVIDVCVDIRPGSPTYGRHVKVPLDGRSPAMLWVPPGFAHGFVALEDDTVFAYKCTALYHPASERTIRWDDPDLGIDWGIEAPLVSPKDREGFAFNGPWGR